MVRTLQQSFKVLLSFSLALLGLHLLLLLLIPGFELE
jgi:hypothetical protein